jgi:hypothetical protein
MEDSFNGVTGPVQFNGYMDNNRLFTTNLYSITNTVLNSFNIVRIFLVYYSSFFFFFSFFLPFALFFFLSRVLICCLGTYLSFSVDKLFVSILLCVVD